MTAPIVVIGATGVVGQGVCEAVIAAGRPVIAVGRSRRVLAALRERYGRVLTPLQANLANDTDGRSLGKRLGELTERPLGAIAAICGSSQPTSLLDDRVDCVRRRFDEDVLPHLVAARHVLPHLQTHGVYIVLSEPGAESPWAGFGQQSVASAMPSHARARAARGSTDPRPAGAAARDRHPRGGARLRPSRLVLADAVRGRRDDAQPDRVDEPEHAPRRALQPRASTLRVRKVGRPERARGPR